MYYIFLLLNCLYNCSDHLKTTNSLKESVCRLPQDSYSHYFSFALLLSYPNSSRTCLESQRKGGSYCLCKVEDVTLHFGETAKYKRKYAKQCAKSYNVRLNYIF